MGGARRFVRVERKTKETRVQVKINLDGSGYSQLDINLPFLEHMLTLWAAHGLLDLEIKARGDIEVDQHHLVEDIGITMGQALVKALGDKKGIQRYGWTLLPMDESLVAVALDISGRPYLAFNLRLRQKRLGEFDTELILEFFRAFATAAGLTLHITQQAGGNTHHLVEAAFKGCGRALRQALAREPRQRGIPSTKGTL